MTSSATFRLAVRSFALHANSVLVDISAAMTAEEVARAFVRRSRPPTSKPSPGKFSSMGWRRAPFYFRSPGVTRATADHEAGTGHVSLAQRCRFLGITVPPIMPAFSAIATRVIPPGGPASSIYNGKAGDSNPVRGSEDRSSSTPTRSATLRSSAFGTMRDRETRAAACRIPARCGT